MTLLETIGLGTITGFILLAILPLIILFDGYVFHQLWHWFLVDLGLPEISLVRAIGISIIFQFIQNKSKKSKVKTSSDVDDVSNSIELLTVITGERKPTRFTRWMNFDSATGLINAWETQPFGQIVAPWGDDWGAERPWRQPLLLSA